MADNDAARDGTRSLTRDTLRQMDAYWRAANYLSIGQIYLMDNPLLREPLRREHIKPRLLGHWGTTPGLNFIYVHLNRIIVEHDLNMIYVTGPGHGGPGLIANTYLEGTYSEFYPNIPQTEAGMRRLFTAVLLSRRSAKPRCAGDAGIDPRRAANSATRCCTRMARCSTIPICSRAAWSVTARPRPARSRQAGIRTSSSIPRATAPCCRSCI